MIEGKQKAFPSQDDDTWHYGMDLRTYMATQFMAAMLAGGPHAYEGYNISVDAVNLADELITELNKEK